MLKLFWQRCWDVCMGFRTSLVLLARFAPVGMLLGIKKKFFFPQNVASDASEHCIPCVSDHGCCFYQNRRLFYMQIPWPSFASCVLFQPQGSPRALQHRFSLKKKKNWRVKRKIFFLNFILFFKLYIIVLVLVWGGRREEGSGWGTHVYLWWILFDIWQRKI